MTDPKLARGLSRAHREDVARQAYRAGQRFVRLLHERSKRLGQGRRFRPGEPRAITGELVACITAEAPVVFTTESTTSPDGNEAGLRASYLRPLLRDIHGVEEKCYEVQTTIVNVERRRIHYLSSSGYISIFDHAYERYLARDGGTSLLDFRTDFWDHGALLAVPYATTLALPDGEPIFLPCGRGLLAGYHRILPIDRVQPPSIAVTLDQNGPLLYNAGHSLCNLEAGTYAVLDLRTFIDLDSMRDDHEELFHALGALVARHREFLVFLRKVVLIGTSEHERTSTTLDLRSQLDQTRDELAAILARPHTARMIAAARKADPHGRAGMPGAPDEPSPSFLRNVS